MLRPLVITGNIQLRGVPYERGNLMNDAGRPKQSGFEMYMQLSQGLLVRAVGEKKTPTAAYDFLEHLPKRNIQLRLQQPRNDEHSRASMSSSITGDSVIARGAFTNAEI